MNVGLISDTHSYIDPVILDHLSDSDEIWHAGDIGNEQVIKSLETIAPVRAVHGNIDAPDIVNQYPQDQIFNAEGLTILMTHIGGYPGRYSKHGKEIIAKHNPDVFITGHSHILKVMPDKKNNLLHINPGAAGRAGFHVIRTLVRFEIKNGRPANLEVIELGKRGQ